MFQPLPPAPSRKGRGRGKAPLALRVRAALGSQATFLLLALAAPLLLAACGKKGPPSPPGPPSQVTYPRAYPTY